MSGRPKKKVHVYSLKGKYIESFNSIAEYRQLYFPEIKGVKPIFDKYLYHPKKGIIHFTIVNGTIAFDTRYGRDITKQVLAIYNSPFCKNSDENKPIIVLNLEQRKIAEFKNQRILLKMLPYIDESTLHSQLYENNGAKIINKLGLFFKFKDK